MRVAALYDIHGNLPGLDAVLADPASDRLDAIVVGGDALPGPMPAEVLDRLSGLAVPVHYILGNGEAAILAHLEGQGLDHLPEGVRPAVRWSAEQLSDEHRRHIATWTATVTLDVEGMGGVLFCHGTPRDDNEIFTRLTPEAQLAPVFAGVSAEIVVCGHTHMQFDRTVGRTRVVNAGSVGMPFGKPGAYWLLLDNGIHLRHTEYDLAAAAARVRATAYPQAHAFAEGNVLRPPAEERVLEALERAALGA
jgi:predicted phosphodiesterase